MKLVSFCPFFFFFPFCTSGAGAHSSCSLLLSLRWQGRPNPMAAERFFQQQHLALWQALPTVVVFVALELCWKPSHGWGFFRNRLGFP